MWRATEEERVGRVGNGTSPERLDAPFNMLSIDSAVEPIDGTSLFVLKVDGNAPRHRCEALRRACAAYFPNIKPVDSRSPEAEQHARETQAHFEEAATCLENVLSSKGPFGAYDLMVTLV